MNDVINACKMKYALTLLFALFLIPASAQVFIGIKGGATMNWIHLTGNLDDPLEIEQETKYGYYVGATVDIPFSPAVALTPELYFTQRGTRGESSETSLNYLTLPVLLSYQPHPKLALQAGGAVSYLMAYRAGGIRVDFGENFDFGLLGGLTYQLTQAFSVSARYYNGLRSYNSIFYTDMNGQVVEEIKILTRSVEIGGIYFLEFR